MQKFFLPHPTEELWRAQKQRISDCVAQASLLFGGAWLPASLWQWLIAIEEEARSFPFEDRENNIDRAFFVTMAGQLDSDLVDEMTRQLTTLVRLGARLRVGAPAVTGPGKEDLTRLDLTDDGIAGVAAAIGALPSDARSDADKALARLADAYDELAVTGELAAAALLYHRTERSFVNLAAFLKSLDNPAITDWVANFRFLGQAFVGRDADAGQWAVRTLLTNDVDESFFDTDVSRLYLVLLLYIVWANFSFLRPEDKGNMVGRHLWWALCFGLPVEHALKQDLAAEPLLNEYLVHTETYAELLLRSRTQISFAQEHSVVVGSFIQGYLASAKENDLDGYAQIQYVDDRVKAIPLEPGLKPWLLKLLSLYLHLRECDLIDFRGYLAEGGARKWLDWKKVLDRPFEPQAREIQEYFDTVGRPIMLKMQIINALAVLPWNTEPYLARVLQLNESYESVYGEQYGSVVFFDEKSGSFQLNKKYPKPWNMTRAYQLYPAGPID